MDWGILEEKVTWMVPTIEQKHAINVFKRKPADETRDHHQIRLYATTWILVNDISLQNYSHTL